MQAVPYAQENIRILVLEDDLACLNIYKKAFRTGMGIFSGQKGDANRLQGAGVNTFEISYCSCGHEAISKVKRGIEEGRDYAVAFLDIRLASVDDGVPSGEQIRHLDPFVEIVFVTGYSDYPPNTISQRVPPIHKMLYLKKPFSVYEIFHFAHTLGCKWQSEKKSRMLHDKLEEANTAIKVLLNQREKDKKVSEKLFINNINGLLVPEIEKLKSTNTSKTQKAILKTLESSLEEITSPLHQKLTGNEQCLTSMEIQVAQHVKAGLSNKEIGEKLGLSQGTISVHRHNMREKLGLVNKKINLRAYLLSLR